MPDRICVIVNPAAGGGRAGHSLPAVHDALAAGGAAVRDAPTRDLDDARALALAAADAGETVVTLGGDGLIGAVADALRHHPDAVMGILPGGRGNDLARALGIPSDPVAACAVITDGARRPLDLGEVDGRAFVSIASAGFDSVANRIANEAPRMLGRFVYAYGLLGALATWKPVRVEVELDPPSEPMSFTAYTVAAANSGIYGGGMRLAPDASTSDGLLDVVVIGAVSRARFLRHAPLVFSGRHVEMDSVHVMRAAEVTIRAERPFTMYADGDPIAELPAHVRTLPAAITVLAPPLGAAAEPARAARSET
jgi:YegS/Rv2252/BmrU family lipid kinase